MDILRGCFWLKLSLKKLINSDLRVLEKDILRLIKNLKKFSALLSFLGATSNIPDFSEWFGQNRTL